MRICEIVGVFKVFIVIWKLLGENRWCIEWDKIFGSCILNRVLLCGIYFLKVEKLNIFEDC